MISHKHKFIIITPPKTGSTAIINALQDCIEYHPIRQDTLEHKHLTYKGYRIKNTELVKNYTYYGTIRNPYERMVSFWKWMMFLQPGKFKYTKNFHTFICTFVKNSKLFQRTMFHSFSLGSEIGVSKFIRFERFEEDFKSFCDDVGIEKRELKDTNRTNFSNTTGEAYYRSFYDEESRKIVAELFKRDLEYFGYSF